MSRGIAVLAVLVATAAAAGAAVPSPLATARLQGQFTVSGRVTVAVNIRGERARQTVVRTWTFAPTCPAGACPEVGLKRTRASGFDLLRLFQTRTGGYSGHGTFYVPLNCGGTTYPKGESVPFTITVHVTAVSATGVATAIKATYMNRSRRNLTNCVAVPGHDAATYTGTLTS